MNQIKKKDFSEERARRNSIRMSSENKSRISPIYELIDQYGKTAGELFRKKKELEGMLVKERDVERIKDLKLRKSTIEQERYEVLADMREMISYVKERENAKEERPAIKLYTR